MKRQSANWRVALVAWLLATVLVVLLYGAYTLVTGGTIQWNTTVRAALVALGYAVFLGWRNRQRPDPETNEQASGVDDNNMGKR